MRTIVIIFSMLTLLTFNGYSQNVDVKGLLDKPETQTEIFNAIVGDHKLMMDFMNVVKENEHASMMMHERNHPMEKMKSKEGMSEMSGKPHMMDQGEMMSMMKDNPEMMQMCMQKMKEKGMMGKDGKMKMMNSKVQSEKEEHNHNH